ncbi:hypothetical protein PDR5_48630 [Pseudomonas sp. DR 5-09]|nr:hypothetical protein PDR5_48630 [Pseudomonas sp. DR 5-09]
MQINRENTVDADYGEHVSNDFRADSHTCGTRTAILTGITKIRNNSSDTSSRGAAEGISHHYQFHQVIVGRSASRLNNEDVFTANVFIDLGCNFAVGEFTDRDVTERDMQLTYDTPSQIGVSVPRKDHHLGHAQYLKAEGIPG